MAGCTELTTLLLDENRKIGAKTLFKETPTSNWLVAQYSLAAATTFWESTTLGTVHHAVHASYTVLIHYV
jgi:hypothetical protein